MILFEILMVVPGLARAGPNLHKANAAFEQTPGDEKLPPVRAGSVKFADRFGSAFISKASVASVCIR